MFSQIFNKKTHKNQSQSKIFSFTEVRLASISSNSLARWHHVLLTPWLKPV